MNFYTHVGGYAQTQADFILFFQYLNQEDTLLICLTDRRWSRLRKIREHSLRNCQRTSVRIWPKHCIALRYDLNWESHWCKKEDFDEGGTLDWAPSKRISGNQA